MTILVTVAHGTRNPLGDAVARAITEAAGERLELIARTSYVELCAPLFADVMAALDEPAVVVPLLFSTGFHLTQDLPEAVARASVPVALGPSFGPDPLLATAQADRLLEAGAQPGQPVVMVAAGSSYPAATADHDAAATLLAEEWGGSVRLATLSGLGTRPEDITRSGDALSPYLLSPGFFVDRVAAAAPAGSPVAEVVGVHPAVVRLVTERALQLL